MGLGYQMDHVLKLRNDGVGDGPDRRGALCGRICIKKTTLLKGDPIG